MDLKHVMVDSNNNQRAHGFQRQTFPEFIALVHSELSEALEYFRDGHDVTEEFTKDPYPYSAGNDKPEGVPSELADVVIRLAGFCEDHHIDLCGAIARKMAYNATRPYKHGGKVL